MKDVVANLSVIRHFSRSDFRRCCSFELTRGQLGDSEKLKRHQMLAKGENTCAQKTQSSSCAWHGSRARRRAPYPTSLSCTTHLGASTRWNSGADGILKRDTHEVHSQGYNYGTATLGGPDVSGVQIHPRIVAALLSAIASLEEGMDDSVVRLCCFRRRRQAHGFALSSSTRGLLTFVRQSIY